MTVIIWLVGSSVLLGLLWYVIVWLVQHGILWYGIL